MKFYAVHKGVTPGVYTDWSETAVQVKGFTGAIHKSFSTLVEAEKFVKYGYSSQSKQLVESNQEISSPSNSQNLVIYTDGSCIDKIGGYGCVFIFPTGQIREVYGHVPTKNDGYSDEDIIDTYCTNNRAELYAIASAVLHLGFLHEHMELPKKVIIYSDSKICILSLTEYIHKWKTNGWKTSDGKPVENQVLIKYIDQHLQNLSSIFQISFQHVYGHSCYQRKKYKESGGILDL